MSRVAIWYYLTVALFALAPLELNGYISYPSPGDYVDGGTQDPIGVSGLTGIPCINVWGTIDGKTNSGILHGTTNVYYHGVADGTAGVFSKSPTDWSVPELTPNVSGAWPTGGTFVHINAWWGTINEGSTYVTCQ